MLTLGGGIWIWLEHQLGSSGNPRYLSESMNVWARITGSTARTVAPSPSAPEIAKLPPNACTRSRIPATPKRPFSCAAACPNPLPSSRTHTTSASSKRAAGSRATEMRTQLASACRTTLVKASCTMR